MSGLGDHPLRYQLMNELHARPFPALEAPCRAAYLAIKRSENAASRDRGEDRRHLLALLDRFGAAHPREDATHWFGQIGRHRLKWESHTEFVTYTIFADGPEDRPFERHAFALFPEDWLAASPGVRLTSALIAIEPLGEEERVRAALGADFVAESLAASRVLDDTAIVASDFRLDAGGHVRLAVFVREGTGPRRIGRIVQRLCEIETYKTMSMLGLTRVRGLAGRMTEMDQRLTSLMGEMIGEPIPADVTLKDLLAVAAELETTLAQTAFRFGATEAYAALVHERVRALREERHEGRQTLEEFMTRRFDPAMRTVQSAQRRLQVMAERAMRAGELLRTRVDVERSAQNQRLLESMDRRADLQLRLQHTVEGLSVVAISYYAVNLATYVASPLAPAGTPKETVAAVLTLPVLAAVWLMVRRIRRHLG